VAGMGLEVPKSLLLGLPLWGAGAISSGVVGAGVALAAVLRHARAYRAPVPQRYCIRVLLLSPLLVVTSIVGLAYPPTTVYCEAVRGGYEAFVLYNFVALMLHYVGGPVDLVEQWRTGGVQIKGCLGGRMVKLNRGFLSRIVQGVLQYVFVRAMLVVVVPVLQALGKFGEGRARWGSGAPTAWLFIVIVQNLSLSVALTSLWMFSKSSKHLMEAHQPVRKFLVIKSVLFVTFWQGVLMTVLFMAGVLRPAPGGSTQDSAHMLVHFLLLFESLPLSVVLACSFGPPSTYQRMRPDGNEESPPAAERKTVTRVSPRTARGGVRVSPPQLDARLLPKGRKYSIEPEELAPRSTNVLSAITHAIDARDVVYHAMASYSSNYARNAYHACELGERDAHDNDTPRSARGAGPADAFEGGEPEAV